VGGAKKRGGVQKNSHEGGPGLGEVTNTQVRSVMGEGGRAGKHHNLQAWIQERGRIGVKGCESKVGGHGYRVGGKTNHVFKSRWEINGSLECR